MKKIKYLIIPGRVVSASDGQEHYISAEKLMHLYGVDPEECRQIETGIEAMVDDLDRYYGGLIQLRPRYDGKYRETYEEVKNRKIPKQI